MKKIQSLLDQVSVIDKKNTEILDATGGRFNIFQIVGVNHYENTHSSIIAEFLNPCGTHGLKDKLLSCFIRTISIELKFEDFDCENARVATEYSTDNGRIDILLEDKNGRAIIIENKIYANDQPEQLKRYDAYAQGAYKKGYRIIYLSLDGSKASEHSGKDVNYCSVSYKYDLVRWLEECIAISCRSPLVRETLVQYINHIKQLTNTDMDSKNKEDITKVLSNIENLKAAKTIYENYESAYNAIIQKHFSPKMEEYAKSKSLNYTFEHSTETYVKFYLTSSKWGDKCWIGFTYDGSGPYYGVANNPDTNKMSAENRELLHKNMKSQTSDEGKESKWWPIWFPLDRLSIENWERDIIKTDNFFEDCTRKIDELLATLDTLSI